jgi:hypothetical protein
MLEKLLYEQGDREFVTIFSFFYSCEVHLHLVPRSLMEELDLHSPMHLHGVVLNCSINQSQGQLYLSTLFLQIPLVLAPVTGWCSK